MSDLAVTERRIRPIQDAAAAKNWKQALQLCDKWQKKGEKSDRFLALKASVLINQPDKAQLEKGKQETLKLCSRSDPVTDIEALHQLQSSLRRLSLQNEEGPKLWERAVSAVPGDKSLMMTWLNGSLADSNWLMAQKAAMALRKSFPKERQYEFWNILFCYLAHEDASLPGKDKMLFGTLAYRLISKAAEAIPKDVSQVLSPGKAIATTEELALLLQIFLATSHADEAITLLRSDTSGLSSKIAEQDVPMVLSLLLQALSASSASSEILEICQQLVNDENSPVKSLVEDDRIWRVVVKAARAGDKSHWTKGLSLVKHVLEKHPSCRAAHLARLNLLRNHPSGEVSQLNELFSVCQNYLQHFKTRPFCFDDLYSTLHLLDAKDVEQTIETAAADGRSSTEKLFALKAEYLLLGRAKPQLGETFEFAAQAVRLSRNLPEAGNERPEAALIGSLALLRLAASIDSCDLVIQACLILEALYAKHGEYYPLAVRLLQAYRSVGLMSLATGRFISLSIKNMQWETVGHLLLTRVSTLHPVPSGHDENSLNPLYALDTALEMLDNMEGSLTKAIQKGLGFGSYANVLNTVGLKQDVQQSLNRQIYLIEERRVQSLVGIPIDTILEPYATPLVDQRDFDFLNNYGVSDGILEEFFACGGLPAQKWLDGMVFSDHLRQYLKFEIAGQSLLASEAFEALQKAFTAVESQRQEISPELTRAEARCLECWTLIHTVLVSLRSPNLDQTQIDANVENVIAWSKLLQPAQSETVNELQAPGWKYLHSSFSELEACQVMSLFADLLSKRSKTSKGKVATVSNNKVAELQGALSATAEVIHNSAKSLKEGINSAGVLSQLIDAAAGRLETGPFSQLPEYKALSEECNALFDEIFLEECCGNMKESWSDALDGLLAIKFKASK